MKATSITVLFICLCAFAYFLWQSNHLRRIGVAVKELRQLKLGSRNSFALGLIQAVNLFYFHYTQGLYYVITVLGLVYVGAAFLFHQKWQKRMFSVEQQIFGVSES